MKLRFLLFLSLPLLFLSCGPSESPVSRAHLDSILYMGNGTEPQDLDPDIEIDETGL